MNEKIKAGYSCVVEDAAPQPERKQSSFIRRIPNPASYFKNDGDKAPMFAAADRHAAVSAAQYKRVS